MDRHGSESYFIIGEGLVAEAGGGRDRTFTDAVEADAPPFRFSRMGPRGTTLPEGARRRLAVAMTASGGRAGTVPAGFTYLGQFVDHDLTFDKTKVMLGEHVSPSELLQGRSPSLDLDSLYGAGPQNAGSAKFYTDDRHLKVGRTAAAGDPAMDGFDLPRAGTGATKADKRRALIPDFRNDENLAVAQTHLAFIRFHNRLVDSLPASTPAAQRFTRARELAVKHYQWMVWHRLPAADLRAGACSTASCPAAARPSRSSADPTVVPTMPVEFSVGAYRLGHSMIRRAYNWNARFPGEQGTLQFLFAFSSTSGDLLGGLRLPSNWIADFRRLYDFSEVGPRGPGRPRRPQPGDGDRHPADPPAGEPADGVLRGSRGVARRPRPQPRLPQPHARFDAQARVRPADGPLPAAARACRSRR